MSNFWKTIKRPVMVLAPMADVTDAAFRRIIAKYGKPDVFWTEFVSADGLYHTRELQKVPDSENPLMKDLQYAKEERPIVAQLFTSNPQTMEYAANLMVELGFDGVDINMGCPHKPIEKQGAGAALMKKPALARELIRAAKRGTKGKIPVSVKTRIGYNKDELKTWLPEILAEKPDMVTIHARTRKEMSNVPARWEHVKEAVELRDTLTGSNEILIIGNGDVGTLAQAREKIKETGADGVMIGRGIFGNPWLFAELTHAQRGCKFEHPAEPCAKQGSVPTTEEKLTVLIEHCKLFEKLCAHKSFAVMKKHFKAYVTGFRGSKELRIELMETQTAAEVEKVIKRFLENRV